MQVPPATSFVRLPVPRGYKKGVTRLGVTRVRAYDWPGFSACRKDYQIHTLTLTNLRIETAREQLSILTVLSNKIARGLNFPHRHARKAEPMSPLDQHPA